MIEHLFDKVDGRGLSLGECEYYKVTSSGSSSCRQNLDGKDDDATMIQGDPHPCHHLFLSPSSIKYFQR